MTFSISRSIPLQNITGKNEDAYANVKPMSSVTVDLDANDNVDAALKLAQETAFNEIAEFSKSFRELMRPKQRS